MAGGPRTLGVDSFIKGAETSGRRLKSNMDAILEKYNHPFTDDDVINLSILNFHKDRGTVRKWQRDVKFGTSQLKSTKRKDELLQRQIGHLKVPIDPNVSMAIIREYDSNLRGSNGREDEPSDAETISSVSSENDDEDTDESYSDDDVSEEEEEVANEGDKDAVSEEDEEVVSEVDEQVSTEEVVSEVDEQVSTEEEEEVVTEEDEKVVSANSLDKYETVAKNESRFVNKNNNKAGTPDRRTQRTSEPRPDSPFNASNCSPQNRSFLSRRSEHQCHDTSITDSISSSLRNMSFVSVQSPRLNPSDVSLKKHANSPHYGKLTSDSQTAQKQQSSNKPLLPEKLFASDTRRSKIPVSNYHLRPNTPKTNLGGTNSNPSIYQTPRKAHFMPDKCGSSLQPEKSKIIASYRYLFSSSDSRIHKQKSDCNISTLNSSQSNYNEPSSFLTIGSPTQRSVNRSELSSSFDSRMCKQKSDCNISTRNSSQNNYNEPSSFLTIGSPTQRSVNASELSSSSPKKYKDRSSPRKYTEREQLDRKYDLPMPRRSPRKLGKDQQNNYTSFSDKSLEVHKSPLPLTSSLQKSEPVLESKFKSPQGIKVKRIVATPVKDGRSRNFSTPQHAKVSPDLPKMNMSLPADDISKYRGSSFNYTLRPTRLQSVTKTCSNDISVNSRTFNLDASFSSADDDLLPNSSELLERIYVPSPQKQNTKSHATMMKLPVASAEEKSTKNSQANTSLTSSLKHLNIRPHTPRMQGSPQASLTTRISSVSQKQLNRETRLPRATLKPADACHNCLIKSGLFIGSPVQTIQTSCENPLNQSCKFCCNNNTHGCHDGQMPHGFDLKKWAPATSQIKSPNRHILSPVHGRLKRKISGSFTSGYYTDVSASPQHLQNCVDTTVEDNDLAMNTTAETDSHTKDLKCVHQICSSRTSHLNMNLQPALQNNKSGTTFCCQNDQAEQNCAKTISRSQGLMDTNLTGVQCGNSRKFAVAKKKIKYSELAPNKNCRLLAPGSQHVLDNQCHVCAPHTSMQTNWKQHKQFLSQTKDSRVCDWVDASSRNAHTLTTVHYSSCPPKLSPNCFVRYPSCYFHNHPQIYDSCGHHLGAVPVSQSKCDHCSYQLRVVPVSGPQCDTFCQFSVPERPNQPPGVHQSAPCGAGMSRTLHCGLCSRHSTYKGCEFHNSNGTSTNAFVAHCQHQNSGTGFQSHDDGLCVTSSQHGHDPLNTRAHAVWREIQSEEPEHIPARDSALENSVPDSLSNSCHSDYSSVVDGHVKQTSKNTSATHKNNKTSQTHVPKISLFLNKSPDSKATSFFEAHSPRLNYEAPKSHSLISTSKIAAEDTVMFPDSYIEQFSPRNPLRIDSDASQTENGSVKYFPCPVVEDNFKKSEPKRHCRGSSARFNSHNSETYSSLPRPQNLSSQTKPLTPKKPITRSSNLMNTTFSGISKPPSSSRNNCQIFEAVSPNSCHIRNDYRKSGIVGTLHSRETTKCMTGNRASTPVRKQPKMPDDIFNETISTIGAADNTYTNERFNVYSRDVSVLELDDSQDSSDSVDLL